MVQSYLAASGPETAQAGMGLNLSAMHLGVGLGTAVGGMVIAAAALEQLPWAGALLAAAALGCAAWSVRRPQRRALAAG